MKIKLTKWFHRIGSPLKTVATMTVNTVSEMASWIIFSCINVNGPPLICDPIRLAGTMKVYSKNANPHDERMMRISGQSTLIFISVSLRLPYQAKVIKTLLTTSNNIVINPFFKLKIEN